MDVCSVGTRAIDDELPPCVNGGVNERLRFSRDSVQLFVFVLGLAVLCLFCRSPDGEGVFSCENVADGLFPPFAGRAC